MDGDAADAYLALLRIVFAISRASSVDETWTTVHLAREALLRGDQVRFVEPWDYEIDVGGRLIARAHAIDAPEPAGRIAELLVHRRADRRYVELDRIDLMLLRAAPLDAAMLTFASIARDRGVRVVNDPTCLTYVSHKGWLASLRGVRTPPTLVTRSRASAHLFHQGERDGVVVKPGRGSGGRGVSHVAAGDAEGLDAAFDLARDCGDGYVVVQEYLPATEAGEKRLVWLDGVVLGGYLRLRAPGEFRHNLKRGAVPEPTAIGADERALAAEITPHLLRVGVRLAGLDVIGGNLIEVNALNPGGAFHTDRLTGSRLGALIVDHLTKPRPEEEVQPPWAVPAP